mmetsp:Transcript_28896/g.88363  ORF Transcript_28896/g.88363 Transcript_28896/m.88363 type:complete len:310 (+) Transcript_28896:41-970(+)
MMMLATLLTTLPLAATAFYYPYYAPYITYDCCYEYELEVTFGKYSVNCGTHVPYSTAHYSKFPPVIKFPEATAPFYTVGIVDPDALSPQDPNLREVRHYLVGNVPKDVLKYGGEFCEKDKSLLSGLFCDQPFTKILSDFQNPAPPPGTGYHRYVALAYEQPGYLDFRLTDFFFTDDDMSILNFNITAFAEFYHLYGPVASNYFKTQFEPSEDYTQCGDVSEGPIPCESYGFTCNQDNQFYYQCLPQPSCYERAELMQQFAAPHFFNPFASSPPQLKTKSFPFYANGTKAPQPPKGATQEPPVVATTKDN